MRICHLPKHFIEDEPRRTVGHLRGVEVAFTRGWWAPVLLTLGFGQAVSWAIGQSRQPVRTGIGYSAAIGTAAAVHALGHLMSARVANAPMDTLLVTPIRPYTLYDDTGKQITCDQEVGRAVGGLIANLVVGTGAILLALISKRRAPLVFGIASTLLGLMALLPIFGNDGVVLFRPTRK